MAQIENDIAKRFQGLVLDLNLDQATADEAWSNYETLKLRYVMEGDQLSWVACAVYGSCRQRRLPTVGGQPGSVVHGNCVSLTRMLHYCNLTLMEFIQKKRLWLKMAHLDAEYVKAVDLLEAKYAVSNNIYKKYRPIFLDLFANPENDAPRPVRSRKQRRPPCNATELYNFCWTLYILIKGKYPRITQDLVMSYSLLLSCIDLMYVNVKCMGRTDLLNIKCEGYPAGAHHATRGWDTSQLPDSIMDYLCRKFEGVMVETKCVRDYYWKPNIKDLVEKKLLKGSLQGQSLLDCAHLEHNLKEIRNAYETDLLNSGEFDERMFLSNDRVLGLQGSSGGSSPLATAPVTPLPHLPRRGQMLPGDYHFMPQTPLSGRGAAPASPCPQSPLAAAVTAMHRLYSLLRGRTGEPSPALAERLGRLSPDPVPGLQILLTKMGTVFCKLYCARPDDSSSSSHPPSSPLPAGASPNGSPRNNENVNSDINANNTAVTPAHLGLNLELAKMRLKMAQMLFYTFLENIINDETKRGVDIKVIMKQELFFRTLFVCCLELVLMCYNDSRRFPWVLQVGGVAPYYFVRIIEPVVRSEQQSDNRLSRELVKHLKRIEEHILDSLAWQRSSPLWDVLKDDPRDVPSCKDVNFSHLLDCSNGTTSNTTNGATVGSGDSKTSGQLAPPNSVIMSPAVGQHNRQMRPYASPRQSPLSSAASERLGLQSPPAGSKGSVERTLLFPPDSAKSGTSLNRLVPQSSSSDPGSSLSGPEGGALLPLPTGGAGPLALPTQPKKEDGAGDRPRRHGSLAIFFRKVYYLANLRLSDLCERLQISDGELLRKIWTTLEYSIVQHTNLMQDRHLDQLIMCAIYSVCKVTRCDRNFQEIMKQYRCQPQADSHIYRSVLIRRLNRDGSPVDEEEYLNRTPATPTTRAPSNEYSNNLQPGRINGTSTYFSTEERGDLIKFYNDVYVQNLKTFALKFKPPSQDSKKSSFPVLSPLPLKNQITSVSPRCRVSSRPVFVHYLTPNSCPPRRGLPFVLGQSPAKDLRMINSVIHLRSGNKRPAPEGGASESHQHLAGGVAAGAAPTKRLMMGLSRRLNTVLDERQRSTDSVLSDRAPAASPSPQAGTGLTNGSGSSGDAAPDKPASGNS